VRLSELATLLGLLWFGQATAAEVRGMTVSCPTWGWEWGTDDMARTLDELQGLGVTWVAIHPYAQIRGDGRLSWRSLDPDAPPVWLERPIREAHARGMKVLVKPHLAYWGSPFSWRGAITFRDEASWKRFFTDYERWITEVARVTAEADGFAVGTELEQTTHRPEWPRIVRAVDAVTPAPLTWAANWDRVDDVPFWSELDVIGVQAYYPLTDGAPDRASIDAGWQRRMAELRALHARTGKHIVFTELGYPRLPNAASQPWSHGDQADYESLQLMLLDAALDAISREPAVIGAFLWKWFPGAHPPRDFSVQGPAQRQVIAGRWRASPPEDAPAD